MVHVGAADRQKDAASGANPWLSATRKPPIRLVL